jgi:hypothetical protein
LGQELVRNVACACLQHVYKGKPCFESLQRASLGPLSHLASHTHLPSPPTSPCSPHCSSHLRFWRKLCLRTRIGVAELSELHRYDSCYSHLRLSAEGRMTGQGTLQSVSGSFLVPQVSPPPYSWVDGTEYAASTWVGIDGFSLTPNGPSCPNMLQAGISMRVTPSASGTTYHCCRGCWAS